MIELFLVPAALFALMPVGLVSARFGKGATPYAACFLVCAAAAIAALPALAAPPRLLALPLGLGMSLRIDALAAYFLIVVNLGGAAASLYAIGYGAHEEEPGRILPFYPAFLGAMNLVVMADDAYTFLLGWEAMSLASWALVIAHHREAANLRAGFIYLVMASFGTLCLLIAFGLLAQPAGIGFAAIGANRPEGAVAAVVLVLVLIGAGSKAGLAPLHVWLPLAHPAAPSHVSALMSGVMTKVALYGLIRITFDLLGPPAWWWAMPFLIVGGLTAVLGVLHALMERDLKRLLAYSTIENIGIIALCLGLALAFRANAMPSAAALALTAALFHALNHMLFKSVLFFGAGAILGATGLRDIERLGGLIHRMPVSSALFLLAATAISALPPLNGFVSEWLAFQAIFLSPTLPQWGLKIAIPAVGTLLALAAALVAGCFVRAFGIIYLGRARGPEAAEATETDRFSLTAMAILAALCLAAGLLPGLVIDAIAPVTQMLVAGRMPAQAHTAWLTILPAPGASSSYNGLMIGLFVVFVTLATAKAIHLLAGRRTRRSRPWDCGYPNLGPQTQYTGQSLSQPIRRVFASVVLRSGEKVDMPDPGTLRPSVITRRIHDPAWDAIFAPVEAAVNAAAALLNRFQFLTIRRYLGLVFGLLVVLLAVVGLSP